MLSLQNSAFEQALETQQELVLKKLQDAPNQLQALSDIAKSIDCLNQNITTLEEKQQDYINSLVYVSEREKAKSSKKVKWVDGFWNIIEPFFVPICAFGSFIILLAMFILQVLAR